MARLPRSTSAELIPPGILDHKAHNFLDKGCLGYQKIPTLRFPRTFSRRTGAPNFFGGVRTKKIETNYGLKPRPWEIIKQQQIHPSKKCAFTCVYIYTYIYIHNHLHIATTRGHQLHDFLVQPPAMGQVGHRAGQGTSGFPRPPMSSQNESKKSGKPHPYT